MLAVLWWSAMPLASSPAQEAESSTESTTESSTASTTAVSVDVLSAVNADAIGLLNAQNGGFTADLWQGLTAEEAIAAINALPSHYHEPQATKLARRLLLTAATVNGEGVSAGEKDNNARLAILARTRKLHEMGLDTDALALLNLVPGRYFDDEFEQLQASLFIDSGDIPRACGRLSQGEKIPASDNFFWQKLEFLCALSENRTDSAEFNLNLLSERDIYQPPFIALAELALEKALDLPLTPPQQDQDTINHNAITRALQDFATLPMLNDTSDTRQLWRVLNAPATSQNDKISAVLRLYNNASTDITHLAKIFNAVSFDGARFDALMQAPSPQEITIIDAAILYQAAQSDRLYSSARADILHRLIVNTANSSHAKQNLAAILSLASGLISNLASHNSLQDYAHVFAITQFYNGRISDAENWSLLQTSSDSYTSFDFLKLIGTSLTAADSEVETSLLLGDVYTQQQITEFSIQSLVLIDKIMQKQNRDIIGNELWQEIFFQHDPSLSHHSHYALRQYMRNLLQAENNGNSHNLTATLAFLQNVAVGGISATDSGDYIYDYLRFWQTIADDEVAKQILQRYFLINGFVF